MQENPNNTGIEKHYSPAEIAEAMGLSTRTVCRMLEHEEGIVRLGRYGLNRTRVTIRIPKSTWNRIHDKWTRGGMDSPGGKESKRGKKRQEGSDNGRQK